jgi:hypothetical protein
MGIGRPRKYSEVKQCGRCKELKAVSEFWSIRNRNGSLGSYMSKCKTCATELYYAYLKTPEFKAKQAARVKADKQYRLKLQARKFVSHAIENGRLEKPDHCENCQVKSDRLESHHYLGYERENWLKISWLCVPCHKAVDKKITVEV